jgi:very-short-patch-repair endonuclease
VSTDTPNAELVLLDAQLGEAQQYAQRHGMRTVLNLLRSGSAEMARRFGARCKAYQQQRKEFAGILANRPGTDCLEPIRAAAQVWERLKVSSIDPRVLKEQLDDRSRALKSAQTISQVLEPLIERYPQSRAWQLGDIAKAHALLVDAGREAVLSRNARFGEADAVIVLQRLCTEGRQLLDKRTELADKVSFAVEFSIDGLVDCVSVLRVGGIFRFCSPRYHRAKRTFLSLARAEKYDRRGAVDTLEALIAFRRRETEFSRHHHVVAAFGVQFRGVDTDFAHFERLASYYRSIDESFGQPDKRSLRTFLRDADPVDLDLIPALPPIQIPLTYDLVQERIEKARADIATLEDAITSLRPCVHVFADASSVEPSDLRGLIDQVRSYLSEEQALNQSPDLKELLGDTFNGAETSIDALTGLLDWSVDAQPSGQSLSVLLSNDRATEARERATRVLAAEGLADDLMRRLCTTAKIDAGHFTEGRTRDALATFLEEASQDSEGLFNHAMFATVLEDVRPTGLIRLVEERQRHGGSLNGLGEQFEAVAVRQLAKAVYAAEGQRLTKFPGSKLDELRKMLAEQDREIIRLSRRQLRTKLCASARPPPGNGMGRKSTWTEMALIENETSKKQRFISVRDLTQRAGRALLELKPCWMMSPLAVAQYVPKGSIHFDLCIIDEASQMPPESAIGALLRCNQTVVVGDTNQLPPSNFFKTIVDDEDADEDETVLNESILEMANATFRPARRLRWHYRSRHSGLIKFSNRLVYDDDLIVFPAATESMSRMGVEFRPVGGRYKAGTNPAEAKAMVEAALEFMRIDPNRSLGLVTLNQKQRDLIGEELEYALANNPQALKYLDSWKEKNDGLEEFFVKNLENVQGDERDVIFIGTVYGAEEPGARVMQRFGPINGLAGRRRLNVLFTRAKQKIVTFSSMTAADIAAEEHTNPGSYMLKRWLEYSASGVLDGGERTEREPDSEFEVFVINQIRSMGFVPVPQVGVAGYFVDIGVRHPEWPHGFVLGVECDGASYHSAKSARDRDRLRQEVLEGLGWRLHRIWSTDWFNNPQREAERIRAVVLARLDELKKRASEYAVPVKPPAPEPAPIVTAEVLPLFSHGERTSQARVQEPVTPVEAAQSRIAIGDTVRVKYLTDDRKTLHITISRAKSDPSQGVIHFETPVAQALLGAEEGDEVEVLVGSYVRTAVVEKIVKGAP